MEHKGTANIYTQRLILRKFVKEDIESSFKNWTNDEKATKYLTWKAHGDIEITKKVIEGFIDNYNKPDYYQWAIELKEIKEPIGTISIVRSDETIGMLGIGYVIGHKWWNKGIVTEAFKAVIKFLFEDVKACKIEGRHEIENIVSGKVMQKCGLLFEGIKKDVVDTAIYGITKEEYYKNKVE